MVCIDEQKTERVWKRVKVGRGRVENCLWRGLKTVNFHARSSFPSFQVSVKYPSYNATI